MFRKKKLIDRIVIEMPDPKKNKNALRPSGIRPSVRKPLSSYFFFRATVQEEFKPEKVPHVVATSNLDAGNGTGQRKKKRHKKTDSSSGKRRKHGEGGGVIVKTRSVVEFETQTQRSPPVERANYAARVTPQVKSFDEAESRTVIQNKIDVQVPQKRRSGLFGCLFARSVETEEEDIF